MRAVVPLRVGVYVFDGADALDVVGAFSVFARWAALASVKAEVVTFSDDGSGVVLASGLRIVPDAAETGLDSLHVLVYPGGPGVRDAVPDQAHLEWLRERRRTTSLLVGVRDGTLVLAAAGLVAGRAVTSSSDLLDTLSRTEPSALVDTESPLVDDGDLVTAAGDHPGIEAALHVVARLDSEGVAADVRRALSVGYP
ncbi:DJ-1/PfpI family protein [Sanguibacter sp. 25GB23B1]|uniref:DJ-1/PfpI family protein n=1 Tax=unclassified Sanguibacter TaxID=2645534 RepID=UPI0032AEFC8E